MTVQSTNRILNLEGLASRDIVGIHPVDDNAKGITITWNVGKRCNYACSYCGKDLHDKTSPDRSFEQLVKAWLRLKKTVVSSGSPARIIFTGGEATLNPNYLRLVEFLNQSQRRWVRQIGMTTNGSESLEYYERLLQSMDFITFSTHFEWWDEKAFMGMMLDLWRRSGKNQAGKWISVNLMYESWAASEVQKTRDILKSENIPWTSYKILNVYGSKGIQNKNETAFDYLTYLQSRGEFAAPENESTAPIENIRDALLEDLQLGSNLDIEVSLKDGSTWESNTVQLMNFGLTNFPGWECHVHKSFYIHNDGVLWAGNCKFQQLGNVYESFTALPGPVVCDGRLCTCTIDIQLEKHNLSPGQEIELPSNFRREWFDQDKKSKRDAGSVSG